MTYLVDTNVIIRFVVLSHPFNAIARVAVRKLNRAGNQLRAAAQNFIEFWNVATRPKANNGLGLSLTEANRLLRRAERVFRLLDPSPAIYWEWRRLVVAHGVSGAKVHDAHLVATMKVHGVTHILTLNTADFSRYAPEGIVAVDPQTV